MNPTPHPKMMFRAPLHDISCLHLIRHGKRLRNCWTGPLDPPWTSSELPLAIHPPYTLNVNRASATGPAPPLANTLAMHEDGLEPASITAEVGRGVPEVAKAAIAFVSADALEPADTVMQLAAVLHLALAAHPDSNEHPLVAPIILRKRLLHRFCAVTPLIVICSIAFCPAD